MKINKAQRKMIYRRKDIENMYNVGSALNEIAKAVGVSVPTLAEFIEAENIKSEVPLIVRKHLPQIDEIKDCYKNGMSLFEIGGKYQIHYRTLRMLFKHTGGKPKKKASERDLAVLAMYLENHTLEEVGQQFGITRERVRQVVNKLGVDTRKQNGVLIKPFTPSNKGLTTRQRFWAQVDISSEDSCWNWKGQSLTNGYGIFGVFRGKERYAHRIAYLFTHGKSAPDFVLHSCDNPACCNPKHLRNGTQADNVEDRENRKRSAHFRPEWKARIAQLVRASRAVLSVEQVKQVKVRLRNGEKPSAISKDLPVTVRAIQAIKYGQSWKDIQI